MNIAIIPARGGSKRIPKKNIKNFCGRPMISYSIKAAIESNIFNHVIVSTDSEEIASIALKYGAEVPFLRPENISDDFATTADVMEHSVSWLKAKYNTINAACCLYATAPLISYSDLINGYKIFNESDWFYVFSATSFPFPIQRAIKKNNNGGIEMFQPNHFNTRSQDLEESFHDAGQFYFGTPSAWLNKEKIFQKKSEILLLPRWKVQDVDTLEDWDNVEKLYKTIKSKNNKA